MLLPFALALVACLYAAVGHAGATGYIAVMGLAELDPQTIRPTALLLNVVVSTVATIQFTRAGHFRRQLLLPLTVTSVPAAALGGWLQLPTAAFDWLVGAVLLLAAAQVFRQSATPTQATFPNRAHPAQVLALLGSLLGLLSGLTGVGGGVFLTPTLLALNAAPVKQVAAVSAPFILVNSLAGLAGWLPAGSRPASIGWSVDRWHCGLTTRCLPVAAPGAASADGRCAAGCRPQAACAGGGGLSPSLSRCRASPTAAIPAGITRPAIATTSNAASPAGGSNRGRPSKVSPRA